MKFEFVTAKYGKWTKRELWTLWEAAFVVGGIEPVDETSKGCVAATLNAIPDATTRERVIELYSQSKDSRDKSLRIAEESRTGSLSNKRVVPHEYVRWAVERGFEIPIDLTAMVPVPTTASGNLRQFKVNPRPLEVPPELAALHPDEIVVFTGKLGKGQGSSQQRAGNFVVQIEKQIARQAEGFFTVEEAAQVLADSRDGMDAAKLIDQMIGAFAHEKLPIRDCEHRLPHSKTSEVRDFLSLVKVSDIDAWLNDSGVGYKFPQAANLDSALSGAIPHTGKDESAVERRERLLAWCDDEIRERGKRGAVQRVHERERQRNPRADRSYVGKQITKAQKERAQEKRDGAIFGSTPTRKIWVK